MNRTALHHIIGHDDRVVVSHLRRAKQVRPHHGPPLSPGGGNSKAAGEGTNARYSQPEPRGSIQGPLFPQDQAVSGEPSSRFVQSTSIRFPYTGRTDHVQLSSQHALAGLAQVNAFPDAPPQHPPPRPPAALRRPEAESTSQTLQPAVPSHLPFSPPASQPLSPDHLQEGHPPRYF